MDYEYNEIGKNTKVDQLWQQILYNNYDMQGIARKKSMCSRLFEGKDIIFSDYMDIGDIGNNKKRLVVVTTNKLFILQKDLSEREIFIQNINGVSRD